MTMSDSAEGSGILLPSGIFLPGRVVSSGGRAEDGCWSVVSDEITAAASDLSLDRPTGALRFETYCEGVRGMLDSEEARLRARRGAAESAIPAEIAGRGDSSARLGGEEMGLAGGSDCEGCD